MLPYLGGLLVLCSPQVRGCSRLQILERDNHEVFPAGAGVFRFAKLRKPAPNSVPRRCGGVPLVHLASLDHPPCSPQVRGCSWLYWNRPAFFLVFPAGAGVFLAPPLAAPARQSVPRRCGGVPLPPNRADIHFGCSPQVRGCSLMAICTLFKDYVFPAGAGVFPLQGALAKLEAGVPRRCGGVPNC